jgi:hypothetical protein
MSAKKEYQKSQIHYQKRKMNKGITNGISQLKPATVFGGQMNLADLISSHSVERGQILSIRSEQTNSFGGPPSQQPGYTSRSPRKATMLDSPSLMQEISHMSQAKKQVTPYAILDDTERTLISSHGISSEYMVL